MSFTKHLARVALLAFLLNALLPFFAVYDMPQQANAKSLFGDKILICTGEGFKWVKWEDLQQQKNHLPDSHFKCPLCYQAAHGFVFALGNAVLSAPQSWTFLRYRIYDHPSSAFHLQSALGSRAPPAPFFS